MAEVRKGKRLSQAGLTLAWGWLVLVVVYISWGSLTERGLYGWLMRWQLAGSDAYSGTLTFALPIAVLGGPSLWLLFGHAMAVEQEARGKPELARAYARRWATVLLGLAGLCAAVAAGCAIMASLQPGYQPPTDIHAAELIAGRAPPGPLVMMAHPERAATYEIRESGRFGRSRGTSWAGYRPEGEPVGTGAPIALFSEGHGGGGEGGDYRLADTVQIGGHPVRDGLSEIARRGLEARGVTIAAPHYVLRREAEGTNWMVGFGLGLFGAFVFGFIGGIVFMKAEGKLGAPLG